MHYQTTVRTDADYADIPKAAAFIIDRESAQSILRLSALIKANGLHCLELFDYRVDWDWGDAEGSTEAETLVVFAEEFCFSAMVKHTNVEIRTEQKRCADLAHFHGLSFDEAGTPEDAFVNHVASLSMWDWDDDKGAALNECEEPSEGYQDSHEALMGLIEAARDLLAKKAAHVEERVQDRETPALVLVKPEESGSDYVLQDGSPSCRITVGSISVHVRRNTDTGDEGVIVDLFPRGAEDESLASTYAFFQDAEEELCSDRGIDLDDVSEWVGLHYQRNFEAEPAAARYDWIKRYLESHRDGELAQAA
ncbi:hypothetical protein TMEC54S_00244 [Thauera mechernichensis]